MAKGGGDTPFSLEAVFDPTNNIYIGPPSSHIGLFPVTSLTILLQSTYYTAILSPALNVLLMDPPNPFPPFDSYFATGIFDPIGPFGMASFFSTATPGFSASAPTPSILDGFIGNPDSRLPYAISLNELEGGLLIINDFGQTPFTAKLTGDLSAVPEPGNLLALSGLIGAAGFLRCRRKVAARLKHDC